MEKERIILIGSGQHANVVLYNIEEQNLYEVVGILDSDISKSGMFFNGIPICGDYNDMSTLEYIQKEMNVNKFFIGFGNMKFRKIAYDNLSMNGWEAVNVIHPNAIISKYAKIGKGVLIECGCLITPNPIIGNNVVINTGSQVNHDNIIMDHVYIASGVILSGGITIEENSLIDDGVIITLGKRIGKNCIIGAGGIVTKDIPDNAIAYGNPAKPIKFSSDQ